MSMLKKGNIGILEKRRKLYNFCPWRLFGAQAPNNLNRSTIKYLTRGHIEVDYMKLGR